MKKIFFGLALCCMFINTSAQKNKIIEKTRIQAKLIEAKQNFLDNNVKTSQLNYNEVLILDSDNYKAHFGLAQCYYKLHDYPKAKFHAEKTIELDPKIDNELNFLLGQTYFRLNELVKAKEKFIAFKNEEPSKTKLKDYDIDLKLKQLENSASLQQNKNLNITIKNMGDVLNSSSPEFAPSISNDGKYLMFTSRRANTKGGGIDHFYDHQYYSDIYLSNWSEETSSWSEPTNKLGRVNTEFYDGSLGFKPDNSLIIYRNNNETRSGDIYIANVNKAGSWSSAKPILYRDKNISKKINSSYFESSASITCDESYIYFISDRITGLGQTDIYYVKKDGKTYSEPINLGNKINTSGDEKCVFIHPSGKILFFTSNGREESIGSYDIYYCTGGPDNWSEPVNMGSPINTPLEEKTINVSFDGKKAYVGGYYNIDNQGDADLYEIDISNLNLSF